MPLRESAFAADFCGVRRRRLAADRPTEAVPLRVARPGDGVIERSARAGMERGDIVLGEEDCGAHDGAEDRAWWGGLRAKPSAGLLVAVAVATAWRESR